MKKKILVVDDNDRYAEAITKFYEKYSLSCERAFTAQEGWEVFQKDNRFFSIVTDVTMETQTSGLWFSRKVFKTGYSGHIIIASTGFDFPGVISFSRFFLPLFSGVGWVVPKKPLKNSGEMIFYPTQKQIHCNYISLLEGSHANIS
jgi:CheY-like chemotaxis protein